MKKGQIAEGVIREVVFPNKGIAVTEAGERVVVKNTIPGQKVSFVVNKARKGKCEGRLLELLEKSPLETEAECPHFGMCGGCTYQSLPYEQQLKLKEQQVRGLMEEAIGDACSYEFLPIKESPKQQEYRNKMEFSFGDEYRDGPLALGMHKKGSFYDLVTVSGCRIVDSDFREVLSGTLAFWSEQKMSYYHRMRHEGYLRHLLVRKAARTGEILIDLVTSSQATEGTPDVEEEKKLLDAWCGMLRKLPLQGVIKGILHTKNDSIADVVRDEGTEILYGENFFYEELLGLRFCITPFSFFQTNSLGAEVLYETAREFILNGDEQSLGGKVVYDLYSGTGTIAQMMAPVCKEVVGVEIVEEAVEAARQNAVQNGLSNCSFLAGDVLKVLDEIEVKPDYIILDPPRDGIHPKALEQIIAYGVPDIVYISCKPTSLARDLGVFLARGYAVKKIQCVDMFPGTYHVETVCLLSKLIARPDTCVNLSLDMEDYYKIMEKGDGSV
jgi:23S rRNA (uracil-5-)-methyltransferase RumA